MLGDVTETKTRSELPEEDGKACSNPQGNSSMDIVSLALAIGFFILSGWLISVLDRL
jgi:hypothetical protein